MKKIILLILTVSAFLFMCVPVFAEKSDSDKIIDLVEGAEAKLKAEFGSFEENKGYSIEDKLIKTFYTYDVWETYVKENDKTSASLYDLVKTAEDAGAKYYVVYGEDSIFSVGADMKVKDTALKDDSRTYRYIDAISDIYSKPCDVKGYLQFYDSPSAGGKNLTVLITDRGDFVSLSPEEKDAYIYYTFNEYFVMYKSYLGYDKEIYLFGGHRYRMYMTEVFPFIDFEEKNSSENGKQVELSNYEDIINLKNENLDEFRKSFKESDEYNLTDKNIVLMYYGIFDIENASLYEMIENAEKQNKKRYVVYDGLEGFKTNYKYEVSEAVLDRYYMLLSLNAHDEEGDTLVIDGESYKIQDKVYFWDITEGLIIFLLTDKGIFMDFRQLPESPMKKFTTDDLAHLKECYEKHKAVNPKNLDIFAVYAFWHDGVNHEELEKEYQLVISKQTSLPSTDIPEYTSVLPAPTTTVPVPTPTPTPVEEPKSSVLWIVLGTAAVILLGAVGVLVIRRKK